MNSENVDDVITITVFLMDIPEFEKNSTDFARPMRIHAQRHENTSKSRPPRD
jgi:hypothetical protein